MSAWPIAYHITFGTYGTRLHGDPRGSVDRRQNSPGDPIIGANDRWQRYEEAELRFPPLYLIADQQNHVETATPVICEELGWEHHINACQPDHLHSLISADADGKVARKLLKRRLTQSLAEKWPLDDGRRWWARGGSVKSVWDEEYFQRVYDYIEKQRSERRL